MDNKNPYNENLDWNDLIPSKKSKAQPKKASQPSQRKNRPDGDGKPSFWKVLLTKTAEFPRSHPIIFNILLIIIAGFIALWFITACLSSWTHHGEEVRVPDVKELPLEMAAETLDRSGFSHEVVDSVYEAKTRPGSVVNQIPSGGSTVKPGRTVYLTVVATTPKSVTVPDFMNVSLRQAQASFEGLGIKSVRVEYIPSEYKDLVLGATVAGREIHRGERIPMSSAVTLRVGTGLSIDNADDDNFLDDEFIGDDTEDELPTITLLDE
ncbi:MAG: PASTA domain-containing protein [Muribaculaceae bacterium]|nr:PASTA domain-containing protein [Muribaculaceae bacterium]